MRYHHFYGEDELQHSIVLESANLDGLLKEVKFATLKDDVITWLNENIGKEDEKWKFFSASVIAFDTKADAMAFYMRWI